MATSILKNGTYRFVLKEWGQTKDHSYKAGFTDKTAACYKQEFTPCNVSPEDHETFDAETPATLPVYGLIDPTTGDGIEKGGGKIGMDIPRPWSDFIELFKATNASPDTMGKPEYPQGVQPGMVDIEVKAIPGSGNFAPKNVMVSWRNVERTVAGTNLFKSAMAKAPDAADTSKVDVKSAMSGKKDKPK